MDDVLILCGGRGTRLQEHTQSIPKPLVEIGGEPIVWHVIRIYAAQGLRRFHLCTGYKGELIQEYVASHRWPEGVEVRCVDTGLDTPTGGRIKQAGALLEERPFCATYADGVADIDLVRLIDFHGEHGALGCIAEDSVLEREPLERLAGLGQLHAYRHEGFWECMDTYKDAVLLNDIWAAGGAPWKVWE